MIIQELRLIKGKLLLQPSFRSYNIFINDTLKTNKLLQYEKRDREPEKEKKKSYP